MLISIIIPVYNVERYLRECLDSVFAQTAGNYEVICVNDGSTDGSAGILDAYKGQHPEIVVVEQQNAGLSAARNAGLRVAKGEYILFLDSDDWIMPNMVSTLTMVSHGQDMICFNGRRFFEADGSVEDADGITPEDGISGWDYYNRYSLQKRSFAFVCVVLRMYRKDFLLGNNLHFAEGIFHEDNRFTPLACYFAKSVTVIDDMLYCYRVRQSSITTTRSYKRDQDVIKTANVLSAFFIKAKEQDTADFTTVFRAITHHYQVPFLHSSMKTDKELADLVDWESYRIVSRTKLRHKVQYVAMRIHPQLFRWIVRI